MTAVEELTNALTEAGLSWGRPATMGFPEIRVKSEAGREYCVKVLRFSFMVAEEFGPGAIVQGLTVADVLDIVRRGAAARA